MSAGICADENAPNANVDEVTVAGFGEERSTYDQTGLSQERAGRRRSSS